MKLLTVAVPAYNIEKYLPQCIESFCAGGLDERVEIIIVNDGSKDSTPEIAKAYADKYPESIKVINKQNGGHGSAVNTGIQNAKGKYFKVVDGDDMVDAVCWQEYLSVLESCDADLVATDFCCCDALTMEQTQYRPAAPGVEAGEYSFEEISSKAFVRMHCATFKTEVLRKANVVLDEHRFYVDFEYILLPIPYVKSVRILPLPLYKYRLGLDGQSVSIKSMQKNCDSHLFVLRRMLRFIKEQEKKRRPEYCLDYLANGVSQLLTTQILIYLSFKTSKEYLEKIKAIEAEVKKKSPRSYSAMENKAVKLLRISNYLLYPAASLLVRLTRR